MLSYNETHLFQNMVQTYCLTTMTKTIPASIAVPLPERGKNPKQTKKPSVDFKGPGALPYKFPAKMTKGKEKEQVGSLFSAPCTFQMFSTQ